MKEHPEAMEIPLQDLIEKMDLQDTASQLIQRGAQKIGQSQQRINGYNQKIYCTTTVDFTEGYLRL